MGIKVQEQRSWFDIVRADLREKGLSVGGGGHAQPGSMEAIIIVDVHRLDISGTTMKR